MVDPKVNVTKYNNAIKELSEKKQKHSEMNSEEKETEKKNNDEKKKEKTISDDIMQLLPEFKPTSKEIILYLFRSSDKEAAELPYPGIIDIGGRFGSQPLGSKELMMIRFLKSFIELKKTK